MSKPLISVIMSVYNEEEQWLRKSVESILQQTYSHLQIIIILDNPENQQAKNILEEYAGQDDRVEVYINEENIGLVASLNKALTFVKAEYVARMDADDIALPKRLELEMEYLQNHDVDFVAASIEMIDEEEKEIPLSPMGGFSSEEFREMMKNGNIAPHPTWLLTKSMYDSLGGYREAKYCEDYDFLLRGLQKGFRCGKIEDVVLKYRVRASGISKSFVLEQKEKLTYLRLKYIKEEAVADVDVEELNQRFSTFSEKDKKKFQIADEKMQAFARQFALGKYGKCIGIVLKNGFTNRYFRVLFKENLQGFMARKNREQ